MPRPAPLVIGHRSSIIPRRRRRGGFALLITITLLAFLVLLLVSLASLTRVETQVAANNQQIAQARQNALLALNIALGELQKHAGPDQRVTARADLQPLATEATPSPYPTTDPASGTNLVGNATTALNSIDTYWRNAPRNRQWTGVWRNSNTPGYPQTPAAAPYNADAPASYNPVPALQSWLVSGNENIGDTYKPTDTISGLSASSTALDKIRQNPGNPNSRAYRLLVKASANVTASDTNSLERAVTAPEIEIRSTTIPGANGTDTLIGHYAWWVGDEGVKARANLSDPYSSPLASTTDHRIRLQSAQRTAIETMSSDGTDGFARLDPILQPDPATFKSQLSSVLTPDQFAYLAPSATSFPDELRARYHDFSIHSRGILADTKNGGLKVDFTYLLGQKNLSDFRTALNGAYGDNIASANTHNRVFKPESTLYATFPPSDASYSGGWPFRDGAANVGVFEYGCTWEQLWSFANMGNLASDTPGGVFDFSGRASPRRQTEIQHGLHPLVIQAKRFVRLRIVGGEDTAVPDSTGTPVNHTGLIWIDTIPVVLIANPYAVPLAPADYQFRFSGSFGQLVHGSTDDTSNPAVDFTRFYSGNEPSHFGDPTFILRSPGMAPGEAHIFTIDDSATNNPTITPTSTGAYDVVPVNSSTHKQFVVMKNDYDTLTALAFNTNKTIPLASTRVALRSGAPQINTHLYMDWTAGEGDKRLVQFIRGQQYTTEVGNSFLLVNPIGDGTRQGGGYILVLNQAPVDLTKGTGYTAVASSIAQQAPFYQVNYRGAYVFFGGSDSTTGVQHTLEWARTFAKNGGDGLANDTPNPWLGANIIRPSGSVSTARWGLFNVGEGQEQTAAPNYITDPLVGQQNLLYDIPRPGHPLSSIGQLQHFNTGGFINTTSVNGDPNRQAYVLNSWQNNYAISNSYPHGRVTRDQLFFRRSEMGRHYDGSYLWNDLLWDRFYFSTYPQTGSFDFSSLSDRLINSRLRPFRDRGDAAWDDEGNFRGNGDASNPANSRMAAQNLLVEGAFNINSTSVEAWKAVFSSLKNIPIAGHTSTIAPFSRTLAPIGGSANADKGNTGNAWNGFYDFSEADIHNLAKEMVMQVRKRGPFTSLSEFINRRLVGGRTSNAGTATDTMRLGLSGALQAALDAVINQRADLASPFNVQPKQFVSLGSGNSSHNVMADADYRMSSGLAGIPGYVLQGDVLSPLGSSLSARSDTFTIRTYGDAVNPATGDITGRAWCEAVVQRIPDYVDPNANAATDTTGLHVDNQQFGRRFHIVSFRWLSPEDI